MLSIQQIVSQVVVMMDQVCPMLKRNTNMLYMLTAKEEEHNALLQNHEMGVVFAVCIFEVDETARKSFSRPCMYHQ